MQSIVKQSERNAAFTMIELLTVMSIIVILFSLLVPSLAMVRRYSKKVRQNAQLHSISVGLDLYKDDFDDYPDSDLLDNATTPLPYCGAMKLAEAMVGQDLLGFHKNSLFQANGMNPFLASPAGTLYPDSTTTPPVPPSSPYPPWYLENLDRRQGPYVELEGANVYKLGDIYGQNNFGTLGDPADPNGGVVMCDVYTQVRHRFTGKKVGMPILYYKASISKLLHNVAQPNLSIYNYLDNIQLINLPLPWNPAAYHYMATAGQQTPNGGISDHNRFYRVTRDEKITTIPRPVKADSYILISAGYDGAYGSEDDIFNFPQ